MLVLTTLQNICQLLITYGVKQVRPPGIEPGTI